MLDGFARWKTRRVLATLGAWSTLVMSLTTPVASGDARAAAPAEAPSEADGTSVPRRPVPPGWFALAIPPMGITYGTALAGRKGVLVQGGRGRVSLFRAGRWTHYGADALPGVVLDDTRQVVFGDALVVSPTEVYVFGSRQTILRWDGLRWQLEHQDTRTGVRSTFDIYECDGRIYASDSWSTKLRGADGSWTRRGHNRRRCAPPAEVPSPKACWRHTHRKSDRVAWCRTGLHIWDAAARSWRPHPATSEEARMPVDRYDDWSHRVLRWQVGETLLVAVGPLVYEWAGDRWVVVFESPHAHVVRIIGEVEPLIIADRTIWSR